MFGEKDPRKAKPMKKRGKIKAGVMAWVAMGLLGMFALVSCNGGDDGSPSDQSSHWDTMVWDQDAWR